MSDSVPSNDSLTLRTIEGWPVANATGTDPRILDLELAERLEFARR